jgi:hypothetical protein
VLCDGRGDSLGPIIFQVKSISLEEQQVNNAFHICISQRLRTSAVSFWGKKIIQKETHNSLPSSPTANPH